MPRLHFIERLASLLVVVATGIVLLAGDTLLALGVAIGGLLSIGNFYLLRALMGAIIEAKHPPRQAALSVLLMFKFALMGTVLFLLMTYVPLDPKGLLIGVSLVVASVLVEGFRLASRASVARTQEHSSDG